MSNDPVQMAIDLCCALEMNTRALGNQGHKDCVNIIEKIIDALRQHREGEERVTEDLVMLIRRLCYRARRGLDMTVCTNEAMNYLERKGLNPSPLRGDNTPPQKENE